MLIYKISYVFLKTFYGISNIIFKYYFPSEMSHSYRGVASTKICLGTDNLLHSQPSCINTQRLKLYHSLGLTALACIDWAQALAGSGLATPLHSYIWIIYKYWILVNLLIIVCSI